MQDAESSGMPSLGEVATLVSMRKGKLLAALLIPPLIFALLYFRVQPVYQAETSLLVKNGREYLAPDHGEGGSAPQSTKETDINSELELLTSRAVATETINRIGLDNLYPGIQAGFTGDRMDAATRAFQASLSASAVKLSNIIQVTFRGTDPKKTSQVLDTLVQEYQQKHAEVFAENCSAVYRDTIARELAEFEQLERDRGKIKVENGVSDIAQQRAALINEQVAVQTRLEEATNKLNTLQKRVAYLQSVRPDIAATVASSVTDKNDEMIYAREAMTDLQTSEASLTARYGADHPEVRRVQDQIATLRRRMSSMQDRTTHVSTQPSQLALQVQQELVMDRADLAPLSGEIQRYSDLLASIGKDLRRMETADTDLRTIDARLEDLKDNLKAMRTRYNQARTDELMDRAKLVSVVQVTPAITPGQAGVPSGEFLRAHRDAARPVQRGVRSRVRNPDE